MIKIYLSVALLFIISSISYAQQMPTPYEISGGTHTATYAEAIDYYKALTGKYPVIKMEEAGQTDAIYPLHVVYYSRDTDFNVNGWKQKNKIVLLINNGIHPGEPDGIDACMMLLRDAAAGKIKIPRNVVLAVIPIYNIGGALNRNSYSRANQNGPEAYGFRGNGQNLDLNRDFIKADARESRSFAELFHKLDPDIFIDNHVSDGADYQHIITLLATQHNKLGGATGRLMDSTIVPLVYESMKHRGYDLVPYVNDFATTPDHGWTAFYDPPRFSSGYAVLFQTMAFVPETHMLKPYRQRVQATYALMQSFIQIAARNADAITAARTSDRKALEQAKRLTLQWTADTTRYRMIPFKGYEAGYRASAVSGKPRLYYDHDKPFTKQVPFYDHFVPSSSVTVPSAYLLPQGWKDVADRLRMNDVVLAPLEHDVTIYVTAYHIDKYETVPRPYEKHYLHRNITVTPEKQTIKFLRGDYIIATSQPAKRYIVETLEPTAPDGFFAWNFFDAILQQKEYFSDYVFEDEAERLLQKDPTLRKKLQEKMQSDTTLRNNGAAQLDFIYRSSPYMEPGYMRYPVFRVEE
ncbi:MAG: hypothetical protein H0X33_06335 [Taibaiella sp.]|nr:hypothetical protein [Taibaiella sp.]